MMLFKAFSALFVLALVNAEKYLQYPSGNNPCIMANLSTSMELTWTNPAGVAKKIPVFSLDTTEQQTIGQCNNSTPSVILTWKKDGATMRAMFFSKQDKSVTTELTFTMQPSVVFNNTDQSTVVLSSEFLEVGTNDTSYKCVSQETATFKDAKSPNNNTYHLSMTISNLRIQAFGITSKTYNPSITECADDAGTTEGPTTKPPTTEPPTSSEHTTKPPTTEHKPTTKHTTEHKPTTKHTTEHTPTTEHEPTTEHTPTAPHSPTTPPITSPKPTTPSPAAHPKQNYTVQGPNSTICLLMVGEFQFSINYPKNHTNATALFGVAEVVNGTHGQCSNISDELIVTFNEDWKMVVTVKGDEKYFMWDCLNLTFTYTEALFPGVDKDLVGKNKTIGVEFTKETFKAGVSQSYLCNSEQTLTIEDGNSLNVWDFQYKAFKKDNSTTFDKKGDKIMQCSSDAKTNSVVPIAVGAALAGLVVIVLIAYLIGRRRNRKGYESV